MAKLAPLWVLAALVGASIEPILVKLGYRAAATPWQFLVIKNLVAAVVILPITRTFTWIGPRGVARVASASALLMATNLLSLLALSRLPAVTQMTLVTSTPALVALVDQRLGRAQLERSFWPGFALCFVGVALTLDALHPSRASLDPLGIVFSLGAVVTSTLYRTRIETLTREYPPLLVSTYIFLLNGALAVALIAPWMGPVPERALALGGWMGLAAALANVAFLMALHLVGATRVSIFGLLQRPLVILAAAIALGEPLGPWRLVGIAMVFLGVRLARVRRNTEKPA